MLEKCVIDVTPLHANIHRGYRFTDLAMFSDGYRVIAGNPLHRLLLSQTTAFRRAVYLVALHHLIRHRRETWKVLGRFLQRK